MSVSPVHLFFTSLNFYSWTLSLKINHLDLGGVSGLPPPAASALTHNGSYGMGLTRRWHCWRGFLKMTQASAGCLFKFMTHFCSKEPFVFQNHILLLFIFVAPAGCVTGLKWVTGNTKCVLLSEITIVLTYKNSVKNLLVGHVDPDPNQNLCHSSSLISLCVSFHQDIDKKMLINTKTLLWPELASGGAQCYLSPGHHCGEWGLKSRQREN